MTQEASEDGADRDTPLPGRRAGDRRVRVERPHSRYFRYAGPGVITARPAGERADRARRTARRPDVRRLLFGRPLATDEELEERLSEGQGAGDVFSSDNL